MTRAARPEDAAERGDGPASLTDRVKGLALALGFDRVGVAPALPTRETRFLRDWLARGHAGEMAWIGRRAEERVDPRRVLEGARSVIALGFVYDPGPRDPAAPGDFAVARYAGGDDYHDVLLDRVRALEAGLPALADAPVRTRGYVDTGPVLERAFAARAGLGWIGKNSCLIDPQLGSYLFLAVVLTDLALDADAPEPDHCGSCRACLDACPTDAFPEPYVLDATRCLSYTTIELRGAIPEPLREGHGAWGFGCDVCQEVCPWNQRERRRVPDDPHGLRARIAPRPEWVRPSIAWVLGLSEERWQGAARRTALKRTRYRGLLRNALVAAGNAGPSAAAELVPLVRRHAAGDDPLLAEHARWALRRLGADG
ncbi:MAG: tRNA epoxyqueuosine(34) reductase QueG [Myxococcota bacterium]